MYIGEVIKEYREKNNISQRAFASRTSLSASYINTLEKIYNPKNGKPYSVTIEATKEIAKAMLLSIEDLLVMLNENQEFILNNSVIENELTENKQAYPLLGTVKGGYDYLASENIIGFISIDDNDIQDIENYYALKVTGDSMYPLMGEDDIIIVHKQTTFENGQTCIILINGDEATVKNVFKTNSGIKLVALNPYVPPKEFSFEEVEKIPVKIIGVVKEVRNRSSFK